DGTCDAGEPYELRQYRCYRQRGQGLRELRRHAQLRHAGRGRELRGERDLHAGDAGRHQRHAHAAGFTGDPKREPRRGGRTLARLPDDQGLAFWVKRFRTAQCSGSTAVRAEVESISSQFATGSEYLARNRGNGQYVGDLYNAFMRRGGDLTGVGYWIGQLATS